jgi:predicted enzyme related to lactoylglutathione lyase
MEPTVSTFTPIQAPASSGSYSSTGVPVIGVAPKLAVTPLVNHAGSNRIRRSSRRFGTEPTPDRRCTPNRRTDMDYKLELVAIPVSDVDRAKEFYIERAGFNADHDHAVGEGIRFVQLTPPGSACSIAIGNGVTDAAPGSVRGMQVVVSDIEAAHAELAGRGVDVSEIQDFPWGSFVFFADPDGNRWAVQQIEPRSRGGESG